MKYAITIALLALLALVACDDDTPHEEGDAWSVRATENTCHDLDRSPTTITALDVAGGCETFGDTVFCRWSGGNNVLFDFESMTGVLNLSSEEAETGWCLVRFDILELRTDL